MPDTSRPGAPGFSRRRFLRAGAGIACAGLGLGRAGGEEPAQAPVPSPLDFPLVDCHVHLDNSTIDKVVELSRQRNVKFGIVEHAGTEENKYPVVLSSDEELGQYLAMLEGKGVYRGVQAEWIDWSSCFSEEMLARLDFVLMDAMTFPGKDGRRVKLWEKDAPQRVGMEDEQAFMDRFVDWHAEIIARQPIGLLGNASWLPGPLAARYDALWTPARVRRVAEAAVRHGVALEISASYRLPKLAFLKTAKQAGVKFAFGTNGRYPNMGRLDYCVETAKELGLTKADMFTPGVDRRKPSQNPPSGSDLR